MSPETEWCDLSKGRTCPKCGRTLHPRAIWPTRRVCRRGPSKLRQAWSYSQAVVKWEFVGKPTRSAEEIESILAICQACPHYTDDGRPRCGLCGCSINNLPNGLVNKIAMATESCPLDPPKWIAT